MKKKLINIIWLLLTVAITVLLIWLLPVKALVAVSIVLELLILLALGGVNLLISKDDHGIKDKNNDKENTSDDE